jgi:hypothetical protein
MKKQELLDNYSDYLISAFGQTTGTGLAGFLGNSVSHDQVQRLLAQDRLGSAELWQMVKPYVRQIQEEDGVMILDDSIAEKPYTDDALLSTTQSYCRGTRPKRVLRHIR